MDRYPWTVPLASASITFAGLLVEYVCTHKFHIHATRLIGRTVSDNRIVSDSRIVSDIDNVQS